MTSAPANRHLYWSEYIDSERRMTTCTMYFERLRRRFPTTFQKVVDLFTSLTAVLYLRIFRSGDSSSSLMQQLSIAATYKSLVSLKEKTLAIRSASGDLLNETELARLTKTRSLEGPPFRNCVEDTLTQLFGHSWQYRGQIVRLVKSLSGAAAVTGSTFCLRDVIPRQEESKL